MPDAANGESAKRVLVVDDDNPTRQTIARMLDHFGVLLAAALADPEVVVAELPLLAPGEREQLWRREREVAGVAVCPGVRAELVALGRELGVDTVALDPA